MRKYGFMLVPAIILFMSSWLVTAPLGDFVKVVSVALLAICAVGLIAQLRQ